MVTKEFKGVVRGEYGKTPVAIDPEFIKKIIGDEPVISHRPADDIPPEMDTLRAKIPAGYLEQDEDILSYALFEQVALKYFEHRKNQKYGVDSITANKENGVHSV